MWFNTPGHTVLGAAKQTIAVEIKKSGNNWPSVSSHDLMLYRTGLWTAGHSEAERSW